MQDCKHNCTYKIYLTTRIANSVIQIMPRIVAYYSPWQSSCCKTAACFSAWLSAGLPYEGQWQRQDKNQVRKFIIMMSFHSSLFGVRKKWD